MGSVQTLSKFHEDSSHGERKYFVLDTNVILHDPGAIFVFGNNYVVIPIKVLEEVDKFKRDLNETGKNARHFSRMLDSLRQFGSLSQGVPLQVAADAIYPQHKKTVQGELRIQTRDMFEEAESTFKTSKVSSDMQILMTAIELSKQHKRVILVTKDVNFRVRADVYGIMAVDYENEVHVNMDELYPGWRELKVNSEHLQTFFKKRELVLPDIEHPFPNEFYVLKDQDNEKNTALARWDHKNGRIVPILELAKGLWGVMPRNKEQRFAIDMLMNDEVPLVTLVGKAGTGKTMLALAAGLVKVLDENAYAKMLVSRSIFPLGRDLGALPGELEEKLRPWMQPIYDNFEFLLSTKSSGSQRRASYRTIMDFGQVEIEALTYIRGRTIPNQWLVVDEAQNLTPHEIKTIITRAGEGTKVILTGDPYQIDNPYIDASNNAITYVADRFKDQTLGAHVVMTKGERSPLSEMASNIL